jgi:predicted nucleic acid-binding protein
MGRRLAPEAARQGVVVRVLPTVYIETTIPSFYFEVRQDPGSQYYREATRRWWERHAAEFLRVTSGFTLLELQAAPDFIREPALEIMRDVPVLEVPARFEEVVAAYVSNRVMPQDAQGDAAHLAMASLYGCDYLLTWNCRHLANARKARHIQAVNGLLGLPAPLIVTPEALVEEGP